MLVFLFIADSKLLEKMGQWKTVIVMGIDHHSDYVTVLYGEKYDQLKSLGYGQIEIDWKLTQEVKDFIKFYNNDSAIRKLKIYEIFEVINEIKREECNGKSI